MRRANRFAAIGALVLFVRRHGFVGAALGVAQARRTHAPASLGRVRMGPLRVPVADDPAAAGARREASGAGRMPVLGAGTLMCRAVLEPARRTDAHLLLTRGLGGHAALGDTARLAEVFGAA